MSVTLILSLILMLILLIIIFLIIIYYNFLIPANQGEFSTGTGSNLPSCSRLNNLNLLDASKYPCCCNSGSLTGNRYIPNLDMVIGLSDQQNYLQVCTGYCRSGYDNENQQCISPEETKLFNECLTRFSPVDKCSGSILPVGTVGTQLYYPIGIGRAGYCDNFISYNNPALLPEICSSTDFTICRI